MKRRTLMAQLGLAAASSALAPALAWATNQPLHIDHAQGRATLPAVPDPRRVAVFDPASLDTLHALGVSVAGVPKGSWPQHLKHYADPAPGRVTIGTLFEPDLAVLKELQPELIILGRRTSGKYAELSALAPTIDLDVDPAHFVDGVRRNLKLLGQIFDRSAQADALDAALSTELAGLRSAATQAGPALTLFTVAGNTLVHAPGERYGMLHEITGMPSSATAAPPQPPGPRPAPGSPEALERKAQAEQRLSASLAGQPQWLFVLDRDAAVGDKGGQAAQTLAQHPGVSASPAWSKQQVIYLDGPSWYVTTGGYQGLLQGVKQVRQSLAAAR